jgi:hypothetical protein
VTTATPQLLANQIDRPDPSPDFLAREAKGEISPEQGARYRRFLARVAKEFLTHPVVVDNRYTQWFAAGEATDDELRHFTTQFSVFSNQFLIAQLKKMIASDSIESMRNAKEILANEIGAIFSTKNAPAAGEDVDPDVVSIEGTVDGGTFRFRAAHFEWLVNFAKPLGLTFQDMGKRKHGTPSTLFFCDELIRVYGSDDANVGSGASFAIENWAAAGFWQELEDGLRAIKESRHPDLHLGFWVWHNRIEAQHAGHTIAELEEEFLKPGFNEESFLEGGRAMMKALIAFWGGLDSDRVYAANPQGCL